MILLKIYGMMKIQVKVMIRFSALIPLSVPFGL